MADNNKIKIAWRSSSIFRPLTTPYGEIDNIKLYDESGVWYDSKRGWLEIGGYNLLSSKDSMTIYSDHELKLRRKLNLTNKDNFVINEKRKYSNVGKALYLYHPKIKSNPYIAHENDYEINYLEKCEDVKLTIDIKEPQKNKASDSTEYTLKTVNKFSLDHPFFSETKLTTKGKKLKKLEDELEEVLGNDQSIHLDVKKLMEHFTITKKKPIKKK